MSIPISSSNSNPVSPGRLTPVGRGSATGFRSTDSPRDTETVIHLSDEARAILAGLAAPDSTAPPEFTVVPAPPDDADIQDAEFEPVWGAPSDKDEAPNLPPGQKAQTAQQERAIQELRARDVEVRAHEAAHAAVAGSLGGRPSLEYVIGPDGQRYAVGGEVSVDTSPGRTPEETIAKARTIRAAATAPASPSAQDLAVAAAATRMEAEAQAAVRERHQVESRGHTDDAGRRAGHTDEIRRVSWTRIGAAGETAQVGGGESGAVDIRATTPSAHTAPAAAATPATPDPEMMMLQLVREQASARGGMGHTHLSGGCGYCRRAASTYAVA